jgi:hypothetical protein
MTQFLSICRGNTLQSQRHAPNVPMMQHNSRPKRTGKSQSLKVMAVFLLAVLALMALQVAATRVHQMRWQLLERSK